MEPSIGQHKKKMNLKTENLAFPEVQFEEDASSDSESELSRERKINYDCAVPEIHTGKAHRENEQTEKNGQEQ